MNTLIIVVATVYAVWIILGQFGVFEIASAPKRAVNNHKASTNIAQKRKREQSKLKFYSGVTDIFRGMLMNPIVEDNHQYYIDRLEIRSEPLNRLYTPDELRGKHAFPVIASLLLIPLGVFAPLFWLITLYCLFRFVTYQVIYKAKIRDEDQIIDNYFIDLYLLMYSKLKQGSRARLQGTVQNYIDTLEGQFDIDVQRVMLKLSRYLLNLLSLYEDHVAVPKLKDIYRSATIINFCNVATQSLNGIENWDNLLTFKMQLTVRKTDLMRKRSDKIVRSGERAIYAIWVILFIFVAVGWYAKVQNLY